jgi:hypothetical protein
MMKMMGRTTKIGNFQNCTPNAAEESLTLDHFPSDGQTLIHEWLTEHDIPWSQKSYHDQVVEPSHAVRYLEPPPSLARIVQIFGITKGTITNHVSESYWSEQKEGRPSWLTRSQRNTLARFTNERFAAGAPS